MPDKITHQNTFTMPTIWPEILINTPIKKHPRLSFAKTKELPLGTPSIVLPESILPTFDLALHLVRNKRHASDAQPVDILAEVDLFFLVLKVAWPDKATGGWDVFAWENTNNVPTFVMFQYNSELQVCDLAFFREGIGPEGQRFFASK